LYLLAKNLKMFPNIGLAELHRISQIHVCTCLHSSSVKEIVQEIVMFTKIIIKVQEKFVKLCKDLTTQVDCVQITDDTGSFLIILSCPIKDNRIM
jgi:superfamily II helicase